MSSMTLWDRRGRAPELVRDRFFLLFGCGENDYSWRGVGFLAGVYFGAIFAAAVISPCIYDGFLGWAENDPNGINAFFARKPFPRYFDRLRWVAILALLPWLLKTCGLLSAERIGLSFSKSPLRPIAVWAGIGLLLPGAVTSVQLLAPTTAWDWEVESNGQMMFLLASSLLAAVALGLAEETIFRGLLLRMFYTAMRPWSAIIGSAFVFAALHFKEIPDQVWSRGDTVDLSTGIEVGVWTVLGPVHGFDPVMFLNLFLTGIILSVVFLKTGSLWPCIGLHGGWVFYRLAYSRCINLGMNESNILLGSEKIVDGLAATVVLAVMAAILIGQATRQDDLCETENAH